MLGDYFAGCVETLILLPKKNGKTTLMAALALFHLLTTDRAECVIAAASRDQATILYDQARGFVERSPGLQRRLVVKKGTREIRHRLNGGRIRVLASDVQTADGVIPTLAIVDELHRHKNDHLYGVFRDGLGPRQGQIITISTAGDDEESPLGQMRRKALRDMPHIQRRGRHTHCRSRDGSFAMHEWALKRTDDRNDMACVKLANPASWQTIELLSQRRASPSMKDWQWARFACGLWEKGEDTKIQPEEWDALYEEGVVIPPGSPIYVGMDLGWKWDWTAIVPLWVERPSRRVISDVKILKPPGGGALLDERKIVKALCDLDDQYEVLCVVYDPNAGAQQLVQQLERERDIEFVEHSQDAMPMALASRRVDEAIRTGAFVHDGHPGLRSCALNAVEKRIGSSGEKWKYDRPAQGPRVPIDGLTALEFANSVAVADLEDSEAPLDPSSYRIEVL